MVWGKIVTFWKASLFQWKKGNVRENNRSKLYYKTCYFGKHAQNEKNVRQCLSGKWMLMDILTTAASFIVHQEKSKNVGLSINRCSGHWCIHGAEFKCPHSLKTDVSALTTEKKSLLVQIHFIKLHTRSSWQVLLWSFPFCLIEQTMSLVIIIHLNCVIML